MGLSYVEKEDEAKAKRIELKKKNLITTISNKMSLLTKLKFAPNLAKTSVITQKKEITLSKKENPFERLSQIPAFEFLFNLMETYAKSKDHLA